MTDSTETGSSETGSSETADKDQEEPIMVIGPDGQPMAVSDDEQNSITSLVEQPAKVMRIGSMIRQLLEEVKAAPLDEASRNRLAGIHRSSIAELEHGLAPELVEELERLSLPFTEDGTPSESELRIAQAQLVGWLEGLFHGIQTAIYAQQMAARAQFEQIRRALPAGAMPGQQGQQGQQGGEQRGQQQSDHSGGGMYL